MDQPLVIDNTVGWIGVVLAILFFGSGGVFIKIKPVQDAKIDPMVLQLYYSLAVFVFNFIVLAIYDFEFDYWGAIGAALWIPAAVFANNAIGKIGLAVTQGIISGGTIVLSFLYGVVIFQQQVSNIWLTLLGILLLLVGLVGCISCKRAAAPQPKAPPKEPKAEVKKQQGQEDNLMSPEDGRPTTPTEEAPILSDHMQSQEAEHFQSDIHEEEHVEEILPHETSSQTTNITTTADWKNKILHLLKQINLDTVLGFTFAFITCILNATCMVPTRLSSQKDLRYCISFGIGCAIFTPIYFIIYHIVLCKKPVFHFSSCSIPGLLLGCCWSIGNIGATIASLSPLGLAIGFPLTQCCLVVAGLWSIAVFREITAIFSVIQFFVSCGIILGGCTLLGLFGSA